MYGEIGTKPTVMPHIECGRIAILRTQNCNIKDGIYRCILKSHGLYL